MQVIEVWMFEVVATRQPVERREATGSNSNGPMMASTLSRHSHLDVNHDFTTHLCLNLPFNSIS